MARTDDLTNFLVDVATAIKAKKGSQTDIPAANFDTEIASIDTVNNQNKTITPTTSQQTITADQGYTGIGTATVNAVTSAIDQNITSNNIRKDVTILGVTGNLEEGIDTSDATATASDILLNKTAYVDGVKLTGSYVAEDLTSVLNAQDERIAELETALEGKTAGAVKPNIYVQTTEPTAKKGIWLQTDKTAEHYVSDDDIFVGNTWAAASETANIPNGNVYSATISVGTDIYILGGDGGSNRNLKYNTLTNTYTQLTNIPYNARFPSAASVGTDIYIFGGESAKTTAYKYDILTDTYTRLADIPYQHAQGSAASVGTDIYIFGSDNSNYNKYAYKYNTLTDTYTQLTNIPKNFVNGAAVSIGTNIYLLCTTGNYKYNTLTGVYTQLTNIPYGLYFGLAVTVGTNIYLLGGRDNENKAYKYDTLTSTSTKLTDIPYRFYDGGGAAVGNNIYLLGGGDSYRTNRKFIIESKTYETDNTVVVAQGRTYDVGYNIQLFNTNFEANFQPLYGFADAWFYTTQDGLITDIPTYYGDGTQWINIKNPIVEEVEE